MKIETTTITQQGNEVLGSKEKTLYYLVVKNAKDEKLIINVGEKTHEGVKKLLEGEEEKTDIGEKLQKANDKIKEESGKQIKK